MELQVIPLQVLLFQRACMHSYSHYLVITHKPSWFLYFLCLGLWFGCFIQVYHLLSCILCWVPTPKISVPFKESSTPTCCMQDSKIVCLSSSCLLSSQIFTSDIVYCWLGKECRTSYHSALTPSSGGLRPMRPNDGYYRWKDIQVGEPIVLLGKSLLIMDADAATKQFIANGGILQSDTR